MINSAEKNIVLASINMNREDKLIEVSCGVYTLARYLEKNLDLGKDIVIKVVEFLSTDKTENISKTLLSLDPYMLGFSCYVWNSVQVIDICSSIKRNKDLPIVLGGPDISDIPYFSLLESSIVDFLIKGSGEYSLKLLIENISKAKRLTGLDEIPGLIYKDPDSGSILQGSSNINQIHENYTALWANNWIKLDRNGYYSITIDWSRGCPCNCSYCNWGATSEFSSFHLHEIREDLVCVLKNSTIQSITISHCDAFINLEEGLEILNIIGANNQRYIPVYLNVALRSLTEELLEKSKHAKGVELGIGIQSTTDRALKLVSRGNIPQKKMTMLEYLRKQDGFPIYCDLILGLPGDTVSSIKKSLTDVFLLRPKAINIFRLQVLKNSAMWRHVEELGLETESIPPYRIISTKELTSKELAYLTRLSFWVEVVTWDVFLRDALIYILEKSNRKEDFTKTIDRLFSDFVDPYYTITMRRNDMSLICTTDKEHGIKDRLYTMINSSKSRHKLLDELIKIANESLTGIRLLTILNAIKDYRQIMDLTNAPPIFHSIPKPEKDRNHLMVRLFEVSEMKALILSWSPNSSWIDFDNLEESPLLFYNQNNRWICLDGLLATTSESKSREISTLITTHNVAEYLQCNDIGRIC